MRKSKIIDVISYLYIALFLYTGLYKLSGQEIFRSALNDSPLLKRYSAAIAIVVPSVEVLIALSLLLPFFTYAPGARKWGLRTGTGLMALFTLYVSYMLKFSHGLPCSCGGIIQKMNWHQHLYFNTLFTFLGLLAIWLDNQDLKSERTESALV